ncbi:MAG: hypothetical protein KY467_14725, partial [Gemmatimonadetes bacterium]|nr:hypothetical protein [Gemmatimonadota bacterium]
MLRSLARSKPDAAAGFIRGILRDPAKNAALIPDTVAVAEKIGGPEMAEALVGVAGGDAAPQSLLPVLEALARMKAPAAVAPASKLVRHEDPKVALAAVNALAAVG